MGQVPKQQAFAVGSNYRQQGEFLISLLLMLKMQIERRVLASCVPQQIPSDHYHFSRSSALLASRFSIVFLRQWPAEVLVFSWHPPEIDSVQGKLNWTDVWETGMQLPTTHLTLANSMWFVIILPWL